MYTGLSRGKQHTKYDKNKMAQIFLASVLVFLQILGVVGADICYEYSYSFGTERYYGYCPEGCCGYTYDRKCCEDESFDASIVGIIAGCVIGGIVFLGFIVSLVFCLVCMGTNKTGNRGRVIVPLTQQQGASNVAYVSTHANWAYTGPYPSQPQVLGHTMGYSQYGRTTGTFPQPPPYEHQQPPSTAPPEYPASSELYDPLSSSAQGLPPIDGTSTQRLQTSLPPVNHGGIDTSKV
ncbi:uncharacterized protein LOC110460696 [Mizuhopecten yessoensis]|uniref:Cysteine and tyrosine-rich protein 1 n=1 Tax=Mizuhopecten yessoensis TaxID=6573 RepID=A0A210Q1W4_MIZYE|nr:uncharacterized protein LOC110460696 [Mizuhopecten yessoensis]OWF42721.1 hypothetical protein KP79_PYT17013 [Mizuhopecten yessoensis]